MSLKIRNDGICHFELFICLIFTLIVMRVEAESGDIEVSSGNELDLDDDDYDIESTFDYSKLTLCATLLIVVAGPPFLYYSSYLYTKHSQGFLRVMSLLYWGLFWLFLPFIIGYSATQCHQFTETLHITNMLALIFLPIFWLIMVTESWISRE